VKSDQTVVDTIPTPTAVGLVVLISADAEWQAVLPLFPAAGRHRSPYGEWFSAVSYGYPVVFMQGGWGKIAAAGSTQYAVDRWQPSVLVNLGTCGGFAGEIEPGEVILVECTLVYDIIEQMGDAQQALNHFTTDLDLSWLKAADSLPARRGLMISADRDLLVRDVPQLKDLYGAVAGDWESGAIAWVASRSDIRCLILRGVTDLVGAQGNDTYGDYNLFSRRAAVMMQKLVAILQAWLSKHPL
jgi:adenosylhomocysteine nucleosidase